MAQSANGRTSSPPADRTMEGGQLPDLIKSMPRESVSKVLRIRPARNASHSDAGGRSVSLHPLKMADFSALWRVVLRHDRFEKDF